jgi:hypothetical protein
MLRDIKIVIIKGKLAGENPLLCFMLRAIQNHPEPAFPAHWQE